MRRLRRFASVLILPLALQLALSAKAIACVRQQSNVGASGQAMPGMPGMPGMPVTTAQAGQSKNDRSRSDHSKQAPCNGPFGAGECQPLAVCASGAIVPARLSVPAIAARAHTATTLVVIAPPSPTTAPELPPPRA